MFQKQLLLPFFFAAFLLLQQTIIAQEVVYDIQLATYAGPNYEKFKALRTIGYVYEEQLNNSLTRIWMGTYSTKKIADKKLAVIKKNGFKDAFVSSKSIKEEDAVYIVQLITYDMQDDIYWPDWQRIATNLVVQLSDNHVRVATGPYYTKEEAEAALSRLKGNAPTDIYVKKVSSKVLHKVTNFDLQRSPSYGQASGISRNSVKALQELLATEGLFAAKSDGVLTTNTKAAIIKFKSTNNRYIRHRNMAEDLAPTVEVEKHTLQYYVNLIPQDPQTAAAGLVQFKNPISKVYLAYMYLNDDVKVQNKTATVNDLMNNALAQVFKGYKGKTRYDFAMKYSYEDVGQLIRHLKAMYEVVKDRPDMPCWLFERHSEITKEAFQPYWNSSRDEYTVSSDCGSFMELEEMRILMLVSKEFASDEKPLQNANLINRLFIVPQLISRQEMETLEDWNGKLWANLKTWAGGSPLQQNMYSLLRFSFYDALQALETHFMLKGLPGLEARSLGLKIIKESVGCNLDQYCGK